LGPLVGKGHMSGFKPLEIFPFPIKRFMKCVKYCIPNDVDSHKSLTVWRLTTYI